jgi:hypothetical protein
MKYAVIKVINGNYFVDSEGYTSVDAAKVQYHGVCRTLWNEPTAITAEVRIMDENLDTVEDYKEYIYHEPEVPEVEGE